MGQVRRHAEKPLVLYSGRLKHYESTLFPIMSSKFQNAARDSIEIEHLRLFNFIHDSIYQFLRNSPVSQQIGSAIGTVKSVRMCPRAIPRITNTLNYCRGVHSCFTIYKCGVDTELSKSRPILFLLHSPGLVWLLGTSSSPGRLVYSSHCRMNHQIVPCNDLRIRYPRRCQASQVLSRHMRADHPTDVCVYEGSYGSPAIQTSKRLSAEVRCDVPLGIV